MAVAAGGAVAVAVARVGADSGADDGGERLSLTPLMGVVAAFVFVAQMFNFPISGGTTGHLLGAALATALLGPWRAILVMTAVFLVQTFVFSDGGIVVLGANIFNMGVAGCLITALVLPLMTRLIRSSKLGVTVGVGLSAWLSVMLAAALTSLELAMSGTIPAAVVLPPMLGVHAVIGLGEALLTLAAFNLLAETRPDLVAAEPGRGWGAGTELWRVAAVLALGLVIVRLAAPHPDGLEWVAERLGFVATARDNAIAGPLPDYSVPGVAATGFDWLGSYVSALVGMLLCGGLMFVVGSGLKRVPRRAAA